MENVNTLAFSDEFFQRLIGLPSIVSTDRQGDVPLTELNDFDTLTQKKKKLIRTESHGQMMLAYLKAGIIPEGLQIKNIPRVFTDNPKFKGQFSAVGNKCSRDFLILIIDTSVEEADKQKEEIATLEIKIKGSELIQNIKEKLEKIEEEIQKFKKLTLDK